MPSPIGTCDAARARGTSRARNRTRTVMSRHVRARAGAAASARRRKPTARRLVFQQCCRRRAVGWVVLAGGVRWDGVGGAGWGRAAGVGGAGWEAGTAVAGSSMTLKIAVCEHDGKRRRFSLWRGACGGGHVDTWQRTRARLGCSTGARGYGLQQKSKLRFKTNKVRALGAARTLANPMAR